MNNICLFAYLQLVGEGGTLYTKPGFNYKWKRAIFLGVVIFFKGNHAETLKNHHKLIWQGGRKSDFGYRFHPPYVQYNIRSDNNYYFILEKSV